MPRGGKRNGSGRPKGARNKATADLQDAAREYTPQALETLRSICADGESEAARVSAANALLDRGYGKPTTHVSADMTHQPAVRGESIEDTAAWIKQVLADTRYDQPASDKISKEIE